MYFDIAADVAKLSLFIVCTYVLLGAYVRRRRPQWTEHLTKRRLAVLGMLTLAVGGIKLIEDVVAKESGPVDESILWFVREHVPSLPWMAPAPWQTFGFRGLARNSSSRSKAASISRPSLPSGAQTTFDDPPFGAANTSCPSKWDRSRYPVALA